MIPTSQIPIEDIVTIAKRAGDIIMHHYSEAVDFTRKEDNSPVTIADKEANDYIVTMLSRLTPTIPVVAEENSEALNAVAIGAKSFWLVDPLDGTKGFIKQTGEFTVNIALIESGTPVAGVVYVPVAKELYYAGVKGGAYKVVEDSKPFPIQVRTPAAEGAVVIASLSHRTPETDAYIATLKVKEIISAASSLKFCVIAEGKADIYPRFGRTMEWDTAAGHAVLSAAGGSVVTTQGIPLYYGKKAFENPHFIAKGGGK